MWVSLLWFKVYRFLVLVLDFDFFFSTLLLPSRFSECSLFMLSYMVLLKEGLKHLKDGPARFYKAVVS